MLALSLLFPALALAWQPSVLTRSTTASPRSVAVTDGRIFLGEDGRVGILDVRGNEHGGVDVDGEAVVAWDADGDGVADAVACGSDGLVWIPLAADGTPREPVVVDADPCGALAVWESPSGPLLVSSDGATISTWSASGGVFTGPADAGIVLGGPPLLASGDDGVVAGSLGDHLVHYARSAWSSAEAPSAVAAVAWKPGDGPWAAAGDLLVRVEGGTNALVVDAGPFGWGDVDADGTLDLVATTYGDTLLIYASSILEEVTADTGPWDPDYPYQRVLDGADALAVGLLDGDACADVVVADEVSGQLTIVTSEGCSDVRDLDADGWTVADGDCDDEDAGVHPDQAELCDGIDQDCDRDIDEDELFVVGPRDVAEGETASYTATPEGCASPAVASFVWTAPEACAETGDGALSCTFPDDGSARLDVSGLDAAGSPVAAGQLWLDVRNLAPGVSGPGGLRVDRCASESVNLDGVDVPEDLVRFEEIWSDEDLWFVSLSSAGLVRAAPDETVRNGTYHLRYVVRDEDGGESRRTFTVQVGPPAACGWSAEDTCDGDDGGGLLDTGGDGSCGGCCCGGGGSVLLLPALWSVRRRRRPQPPGA